MTIGRDVFRRILGNFATGVTVVTTVVDGHPAGMTVNAFTSVSLDPLLVLFCADKRARTHDAVDKSGVFAINLLPESMRNVSDLFAKGGTPDAERFAAVQHGPRASGAPVLAGSLGWLDCRVWQRYPGGDHTIFVGEVLDAGVAADAGGSEPADPLLYFRGKYARIHKD